MWTIWRNQELCERLLGSGGSTCACYRVFANRLNFAMGDVDRDPDGPPELLEAIAEIKNSQEG
jgi:hypothetical protein